MPVIVEQQCSHVECNSCNSKTAKFYGAEHGQRAAKHAMENQWHVSVITGDATCPSCRQKAIEKARETLL
jgi:DNA-directed RNA polymerase subunit RPC12/RpoP